MFLLRGRRFLVSLALIAALCSSTLAAVPGTIVLNGSALEQRRKEASSDAVRKLIKEADKIVGRTENFSVINKSQVPPSGDKHDYMSQAPYWWPDPSKPNGLPYIRRDGERNPELEKITDSAQLEKMLDSTETLGIAYYLTGDEKYASRAAGLLRTWFLDPKTRQNPNLKFSQSIPGINKGRGIGLIETRFLYRAIDASILISGSKLWAPADQAGLKKWFGEFLDWILNSPHGKDEADERNNHGTHYDVQVVAYAIFTGHLDIARKQFDVTKGRIRSQIEPDGSQPLELARTRSWGYANMNLLGFFTLARLGESVGVDLWNFETADKRSIKRAIDWLVPFTDEKNKWTHQQIKPRTFELTTRLLRIAAVKYARPDLAAIAKTLGPDKDAAAELGLF